MSDHQHGDQSAITIALLTQLAGHCEKDSDACAVCVAIQFLREVVKAATAETISHPVAVGSFLSSLCNAIMDDVDLDYHVTLMMNYIGDGDAQPDKLHG